MPVYEESRYETAVIAPVAAADGIFRATIQIDLGTPVIDEYTTHIVVAGERLDLLAYRAYGDSEFWWRIAEANTGVLTFPDVLTPGMMLRIPLLAIDF